MLKEMIFFFTGCIAWVSAYASTPYLTHGNITPPYKSRRTTLPTEELGNQLSPPNSFVFRKPNGYFYEGIYFKTTYNKYRVFEYVEARQFDQAAQLLKGLQEPLVREAFKQIHKGSYKVAESLLIKATNTKSKLAVFYLGYMYEKGFGILNPENTVEKNLPKALSYYILAHNRNDPVATFCLGWMHEKGLGVRTDYTIAYQCYHHVYADNPKLAGPHLERLMTYQENQEKA